MKTTIAVYGALGLAKSSRQVAGGAIIAGTSNMDGEEVNYE